MKESHFFTIQIENKLAVITFCRPPVNMMSFLALGELEQILTSLSQNEEIIAVVITGGISGFFIAHADVEDVMRMENGEAAIGDPDAWDRVNGLLSHMPQITVAAVNGQAWGGGCELALACDFIFASQEGHFRLLEVSKGVIPGAGGTQRLPRKIGVKKALRMLITSEVVNSRQALEWGLAEAIFTQEGFLDQVKAWLRPVLEQPEHAVKAAKKVVLQGSEMTLEQGMALEKTVFGQLVSCEATKELGTKTVETL